jgi:hypothetical protein
MNDIQKRFALFLFGCILVRSIFVYIAATIRIEYLPYLGYLALIPVIGWIYILATGSRKTGQETMGQPIWWNSLRYVHALLYLTFAILAILKINKAWIVLLVDVIVGLTAFLWHHYNVGSFKQLF